MPNSTKSGCPRCCRSNPMCHVCAGSIKAASGLVSPGTRKKGNPASLKGVGHSAQRLGASGDRLYVPKHEAHVIGAHSKSPYDPMVSIRPHLEVLWKPLPAQPDLKPYTRTLNPNPKAHSKTLKFSLYFSTCTNPKASVSLTHSITSGSLKHQPDPSTLMRDYRVSG